MGEKRAYKPRKPGGGRKKLKPEYDAGKNLKEQMDAAVALYNSEMSLQAIGEELGLNPIKVQKLLITAGVKFKTYSGLPFSYEVRKGRKGRCFLLRKEPSQRHFRMSSVSNLRAVSLRFRPAHG